MCICAASRPRRSLNGARCSFFGAGDDDQAACMKDQTDPLTDEAKNFDAVIARRLAIRR